MTVSHVQLVAWLGGPCMFSDHEVSIASATGGRFWAAAVRTGGNIVTYLADQHCESGSTRFISNFKVEEVKRAVAEALATGAKEFMVHSLEQDFEPLRITYRDKNDLAQLIKIQSFRLGVVA
jgi:hypothetical protein